MITFYITFWYGDGDELYKFISFDLNDVTQKEDILKVANFLEKYKAPSQNLGFQDRLRVTDEDMDIKEQLIDYPSDPNSDYEGDCRIDRYYVQKEII